MTNGPRHRTIYRFCLGGCCNATTGALIMACVLVGCFSIGVICAGFDFVQTGDRDPLIGTICVTLIVIALCCVLAYGINFGQPKFVLLFVALLVVVSLLLACVAISLTVSLIHYGTACRTNAVKAVSQGRQKRQAADVATTTTTSSTTSTTTTTTDESASKSSSSTSTTAELRSSSDPGKTEPKKDYECVIPVARWILLVVTMATFAIAMVTIISSLQAANFIRDRPTVVVVDKPVTVATQSGTPQSQGPPPMHISGQHITPTSRTDLP